MPMLRYTFLIVILISVASLTPAQNSNQQSNDRQPGDGVKAWVSEFLRRYKLESKASPQNVEQLASLKLKAESPAATLAERQAIYKELLPHFYRLGGTTTPVEQSLNQIAQVVAQATQCIVPGCDFKPVGTATTPLGQLGHVEKVGRGPVPMILIPDLFTDWTLYQSFMQRNRERYTMYAVTLPGEGGTPPLPQPAFTDLATTPWWNSVEQALLKLIEKNKLKQVVVVGTQAGVYPAARLALNHPDKVRAAVFLNGMVNVVMRINDRPFTKAERQRSRTRLPVTMMLAEFAPLALPSRACAEQALKQLPPARQNALNANTRDAARADALFINGLIGSDPRTFRYGLELQTTDLTDDLKNLKVPLLVIPTIHDKDAPFPVSNSLNQWGEIKALYPAIPLTFAPFEATRLYVTEDAPQELDRAIAAFLAGKGVEVKREQVVAARPSPRAEVKQVIGTTEIAISFSRPQVKGRKLVPYNRVWRAGANEATTVSFSATVLIEGQRLPAGTYSFFAIPAEDEWTIIFNRVALQWGAFFYNPEFDALRAKVKPQTAEHQEWLSYSFEALSSASGQMVLHWEKVKVPIRIELEPAKTAAQ